MGLRKNRKDDGFFSKGPTHPLLWPHGWPRTEAKTRWTPRDMTSTFATSRDYLINELRALRAYNVLILSNVPLDSDGRPFLEYQTRKLHDKKLDDPGVAVYFFVDGLPYALACDSWEYPKDNMRSIGIAIGHMRAAARNVAPIYLDKLLSCFLVREDGVDASPPQLQIIPPQPEESVIYPEVEILPPVEAWWEVLGLSQNASLIEAEAAFRSLARAAHPDRGGNSDRMKAINQAIVEARLEIKNRNFKSGT